MTGGSAALAADGEIVPIQDVVAKHAGQVECMEYDADSDTCIVTGTMSMDGERIAVVNTVLLDPARGLTMTLSDDLEVINGTGCSDAKNMIVELTGTDDQDLIDYMTKTMLSVQQAMGNACTVFRQSGDDYVVSTARPDGTSMTESPVLSVRFFEGPKSLRLAQ